MFILRQERGLAIQYSGVRQDFSLLDLMALFTAKTQGGKSELWRIRMKATESG